MFHGLRQGAAAGFQVGKGAEEIFFAGSEAGGSFFEILFDLFFFRAELFGPLFPDLFAFGFSGFHVFLELITGFYNTLFQPIG